MSSLFRFELGAVLLSLFAQFAVGQRNQLLLTAGQGFRGEALESGLHVVRELVEGVAEIPAIEAVSQHGEDKAAEQADAQA